VQRSSPPTPQPPLRHHRLIRFPPSRRFRLRDRPHHQPAAQRQLCKSRIVDTRSRRCFAPSDQAIVSLQERLEELQVANQALVSSCAAMDNNRRGADASDVSPAADAGRLYGVIKALLSGQQATQERHEKNLLSMHESDQRSLQEAVAASQALAIAACCVSAALLGIALLRA
jgi:hypothetical protein